MIPHAPRDPLPTVASEQPVAADTVDQDRRFVVKLLAGTALAPFAIQSDDVDAAVNYAMEVLQRGRPATPRFFTDAEWRTVRLLCDRIIPRDARSGSATDAGVPEFIDFMMTAYPDMQKPIRDGIAWMNAEAARRSAPSFVGAPMEVQTAILDAIAYPKRAAAAMKPGVDFFSRFRDLTASGFWSSKVGVADLQYLGNRALAQWTGCPPAALRKMGVG